jgi:hypothetical protein
MWKKLLIYMYVIYIYVYVYVNLIERNNLVNVDRFTIVNRGGVALGIVGANTYSTQATNANLLKYSVNGQAQALSIDIGVTGINQVNFEIYKYIYIYTYIYKGLYKYFNVSMKLFFFMSISYVYY